MSCIPEIICRICEDFQNLTNIIHQEQLIEKYTSCANVSFDLNDMLPKYFCNNCINLLDIAYGFKEKCEYTQNKLLHLIRTAANLNSMQNNPITDAAEDFQLIGIDDNEFKFEIKTESIDNDKCPISLLETDNDVKIDYTNYNQETKSKISNHTKVQKNVLIKNSENAPIKEKLSKKYKSEIPPNECKPCNLYFENRNELKHHQSQPHKCSICNDILKHYLSLYRHNRRVHLNVKPAKNDFQCNDCGKPFSTLANMIRHRDSVHDGKRNYECDICKKCFSRFDNIQLHMYQHMGEKQFECDECLKKYSNNIQLKIHKMRKHSLPNDPNYKEKFYNKMCDLCGKIISSSGNFSYHMQRHRNEKQFKCPDCDKTFYSNYNLKRHVVTHTDVKAFECELCEAKFATSGSLAAHRVVHLGLRPYQCEMCDSSFRQKPHLKAHLRTHTGEKPSECQYCGKRFANNTNLKEHIRLHTGEKPYKCAKCAVCFINAKSLKKHRSVLCN